MRRYVISAASVKPDGRATFKNWRRGGNRAIIGIALFHQTKVALTNRVQLR